MWFKSITVALERETTGHNSILCDSGQISRAKTSLECGPWLKRDTGMEVRSRLCYCGLPRWSSKVETFRQSQYGRPSQGQSGSRDRNPDRAGIARRDDGYERPMITSPMGAAGCQMDGFGGMHCAINLVDMMLSRKLRLCHMAFRRPHGSHPSKVESRG